MVRVFAVNNNFLNVPEILQSSVLSLISTIPFQTEYTSNELKTWSTYGGDKVNSILGLFYPKKKTTGSSVSCVCVYIQHITWHPTPEDNNVYSNDVSGCIKGI